MTIWYEVAKFNPPQRRLVMVTGDSGYSTHKKFLTLAFVDDEYRKPLEDGVRWLNVQCDDLTDKGWRPTHWAWPIDLPGENVGRVNTRFQELIDAAHAVYFAAVWSPDRECDAATLWTELRDAAFIAPGAATALLGRSDVDAS